MGDDHLTFWLALPLAQGTDSQRRTVRREVIARMAYLPLDEISYGTIADCLVNHICTQRWIPKGAFGYLEDGHKLYCFEIRPGCTPEVSKATGILHRRVKLWDRPFPNDKKAIEAAAAYIETLLDPPQRRAGSGGGSIFRRKSPRDKARALIDYLGDPSYTEEDEKRDAGFNLSATDDFLGYGVKHHGDYTAQFYRAFLHRPFRSGLRLGSQRGEQFFLPFHLTVWPFGSKETKSVNKVALLTRLGTLGTACYVMGTIGFGEERYTLLSSSHQKKLFAMREGEDRIYSGKDLPELVEKMLLPEEWEIAAAVEKYYR